MEKSEHLLNLEIVAGGHPATGTLTVQVDCIMVLLQSLQPKSLSAIHSSCPLPQQLVLSADFWRLLHAAMRDKSEARLLCAVEPAVVSVATMCGLVVTATQGGLVAAKPEFKTGGTLLKRKKKEDNPWASLAKQGETINEDELMKDVETNMQSVAKKFCGENDGIQPMKPCANCSCGLKEIYEASQTAEQVVQPAESSCGKCYLGDAFRCAACPYRGQPAFEPGDKLKLQAVTESVTASEGVKTAAGEKVVLEL